MPIHQNLTFTSPETYRHVAEEQNKATDCSAWQQYPAQTQKSIKHDILICAKILIWQVRPLKYQELLSVRGIQTSASIQIQTEINRDMQIQTES